MGDPTTTDPTVIKLDSFEAFRDRTLQLAQLAQRQITIFTSDLEPELYDSSAFVEMALALIKRSRQTRIRIIATETRRLVETGHQLLKLFRYTDEQFQLKKISADPAVIMPTYFICDDHSLIRRQNPAFYQGVCYTDDRLRAKDQMEDFEQLWNIASDDPNLRQLTL